jgi:hypothetical protein
MHEGFALAFHFKKAGSHYSSKNQPNTLILLVKNMTLKTKSIKAA